MKYVLLLLVLLATPAFAAKQGNTKDHAGDQTGASAPCSFVDNSGRCIR